jgi:hypothetical protein
MLNYHPVLERKGGTGTRSARREQNLGNWMKKTRVASTRHFNRFAGGACMLESRELGRKRVLER